MHAWVSTRVVHCVVVGMQGSGAREVPDGAVEPVGETRPFLVCKANPSNPIQSNSQYPLVPLLAPVPSVPSVPSLPLMPLVLTVRPAPLLPPHPTLVCPCMPPDDPRPAELGKVEGEGAGQSVRIGVYHPLPRRCTLHRCTQLQMNALTQLIKTGY